MRYLLGVMLLPVIVAGCASAGEHRRPVQNGAGEQLPVSHVQKEIRAGMCGAEVADVLGSPDIVSTDEEHREVWIYNKVATAYVQSKSTGGISALVLGVDSSVAGVGGTHYDSSVAAASSFQPTLTIILKYDNEGKVRDFAYHTSKFWNA
jgi:hypothetical protein